MNEAQASTYFAALLSSVTIGVIIPLLSLVALMVLFIALLIKAQAKKDFNIERMFMDEEGRVSLFRVLSAFAFAFHSWVLMVAVLNKPDLNSDLFMWYGFTWAGTPAIAIIMSKWNGILPFGKSPGAP